MPKLKFSSIQLSFSLREKVILWVILLLTLLIPTGSYLVAQYTSYSSKAEEFTKKQFPVTNPIEIPKKSALEDLKDLLNKSTSSSDSSSDVASATESSTLILGPTLNFKVVLEARPFEKQATKLFLGIASGTPASNPKYLLSFTLNVPDSGIYKDLSLAGLDTGSTYTAYLKGQAQIASASAFTIKPIGNDLGVLNLITGDVNEDNTINSSDYGLVKGALGATSTSSKWNPIYDFNLDGVINTLDLAVVTRHIGTTGQSGVWQSTATQSAAVSGSINQNIGGPEENDPKNGQGYWIWVPTF